MKEKIWKILVILVLIGLNSTDSLASSSSVSLVSLPKLKVHFVDVGQGDAICIDFGTTEVLIDGGEKSSGVVEYIKHYVDGDLEVIVATHPHSDHIGGLINVLENFKVQEIWLNGDNNKNTPIFQKFIKAVKAEKAKVYQARRNGTISVANLEFTILNPPETLFDKTNDTNNNSIVLRLQYGSISFLFSGDAEKEAEADILASGYKLQSQIFKVGHHASRSSSSPNFLQKVSPKIAIYTAGKGNRYKHPHKETLNALKKIGAKIYGTDKNGTIIVITDGRDYKIIFRKRRWQKYMSLEHRYLGNVG